MLLFIFRTLFFSDDELKELQNSTLVKNTLMRKENALYFYDIISEWVKNSEYWEGDVFSEEEWLWALSVLWSRAFSVKVGDQPMGSLVPMADLFNAYDPYRQDLQVKAKLEGNINTTYKKLFSYQ